MADRLTINNPSVSILMSVYKEPLEWIGVSIESILNQTFTDFEFIIVNDNPESKELNVFLKSYSEKDKRIRIIRNETNSGLTKSLNNGLDASTGKYIARMDADDFSLPDRLEFQVRYMEENPDVIASSALAHSWDGEKKKDAIFRPTSHKDIESYIYTSSPFIHPLLIVRSEVLKSYGIRYDESYKVSQDYKLAADLFKIGNITNLDKYLLLYRESQNQISKAKGNLQVEAGRRVRRELIDYYYSLHNLPPLPDKITFSTITDNYRAEKKLLKKGEDCSVIMNCIRRVLYYSIDDYSFRSLGRFLLSGDYLHHPYNLRRFVIVALKHVKSDIIPALI
ncbi:MAG: glycosyltransferase [Muribaculaceae bacterium]|nr:glycosyltransferase [Muribaculaceae bacterium]